MKIKFLTGLLLLALSVNMVSCTEDEAEDLEEDLINDDVNGDDRLPYVGDWKVVETSKIIGARSYWARIKKDDGFPQRVNIYNFYLLGDNKDSVIANVSNALPDVITVPEQTRAGNFIVGDGKLSNGVITFKYTINDGNEIDTVTAVYSK